MSGFWVWVFFSLLNIVQNRIGISYEIDGMFNKEVAMEKTHSMATNGCHSMC